MSHEESLKVIYPRLLFSFWALFIFIWPNNVAVGENNNNNIMPGDIIITEIMANPKAVSDTVGEWFEIYNSTEADIDLTGCEFTDNGSNKFTISQLIVPAETYVVLARNGNPEENGGLIPDYTYSSYTLTNTEDAIILTCQEIEIDRIEYNSTLGFTIPDGASLFLKNLLLDNNTSANWCVSTSIYGLGDKGTPKFANDECDASSSNNDPLPLPTNRLPIAEAGPNKTAIVGQIVEFDGSGSYDPDGDTLRYNWNFGDGKTATGKIVNHIYQQANIYSVTLTVDDGKVTQSDSLTITVTQSQIEKYQDKLIISELIPNPVGSDDDEWIELYNQSDSEIDLNELILLDASNKKYIFSNNDFVSLIIPPKNYFLLPKAISKINLNNTPPETITLTLPNNEIITKVTYTETAKEGWSLIFYDNEYYWTFEPTPGFSNILNLPTEEINTNQEKKIKTNDDNDNDDEVINLYQNCQPAKSNQLIINELLPSPQGDDRLFEFIELKNISNQPANLCGWSISDLTQRYFFPKDTTIQPSEFYIIEPVESHISLNNSGDQISLYNANNKLADFTSYDKAEVDWSWSRTINNKWFWTKNISPAEENIFSDNTTNNEKNINYSLTNSNNEYIYLPLEEINQTQANDKVIVTGIVTAEPGKLGGQIMYIMNLTGLQIYQHFQRWPELAIGDRVEIKGTMSFPLGNPRLKVKSPDDIFLLEKNQINKIILPIVTTDELSEELIGSLITIVGTAVEIKKSSLVLADEQGEINITIKPSTEINLPLINEGDILEITGILDKTTKGWRLLPRYNNDIKIIEVLGFATSSPILENKQIEIKKYSYSKFINYLYITLIALIILLSGLIYKLKKQQYGHKNKQKIN